MDFSYLLELAKANEARDKTDDSVKFSTKVSTSKKDNRPGPKGNAVKNVIDKKMEEKQKERDEYNKKKEGLIALRENNKRSKKRIFSLINRTKGASKAVLDDAKDITTAKAEIQCDEDDYGYESNMSQLIFSKLQTEYNEIPDDERLKVNKTAKRNMDDIKNRVLNSLKQKHEEDIGVRRRCRKRRKSGDDEGFINDGDSYKRFEDTNEGKRIHKHKHHKSKVPVNLNVTNYKSDKYSTFKYDKKKSKDKERDTVKEKIEEKRKKKSVGPPPGLSFEQLLKVAQKKQTEPLLIENPLEKLIEKQKKKKKEQVEERPLTAKEKMDIEEEKNRKLRRMGKLDNKVKSIKETNEKIDPKNNNIKKEKAPDDPIKKDRSKYFASSITSKDSLKRNGSDGNDKIASASKKYEMSKKSVDQRHTSSNPPKEFTRKPPPPQSYNKRIIDSDSDEDSEMDDFIDDGDAEVDYSSEIAKMFKYDKSKYRGIDENVDGMESSYSQMRKEETYSAKAGLREDLEDMEREEVEKKRKKMVIKGKRK